ncbi:methyltransferase domain-containing protein [Streptomyces canus]|uniref:methyltransferase domain-containing protein n=1 Tax=Streptomyces canus TaxID=58343 RepID=UPI0036B7DB6E
MILNQGCGYGRTLDELEQQGFDDLCGVDTSPGMIARARSLHPAMRFAVPTCIPSDDAPRLLIAVTATRGSPRPTAHGVFETGDGAVCRHRPGDWFTSLSARFETIDTLLSAVARPVRR